jgi:hypothetical protein
MTTDERKELAKTLIYMATLYNRTLNHDFLSAFLDDLSDLSLSGLIAACKIYRNDPKNKFFPVPAQLRELVNPRISDDALAKEAAARVIQAISKFGWPNPTEAKEFIGELGWRGVTRFGGWSSVCENVGTTISPDTFYAQLRDLCKSTQELTMVGAGDGPIALPERNTSVLDIVGKLAETKMIGN